MFLQADLVYGYYGRQEDFDKLEQLGIQLNGTIALIRYGRIHAANKVRTCLIVCCQ